MSDYFIVLDAAFFNGQFRPAMSASRHLRSFEPCRALCAAMLPAARAYAEQYHLGAEEPLLALVAAGLGFDRAIWRPLVREMLLFGAVHLPGFPTFQETLTRLRPPGRA